MACSKRVASLTLMNIHDTSTSERQRITLAGRYRKADVSQPSEQEALLLARKRKLNGVLAAPARHHPALL